MKSNRILVLIPKRTNRLIYIFNHILKELLGLEPSYTTDIEAFKNTDEAKMHYGSMPLDKEFFISADNLLFERGIQEQELSWGRYMDLPTLFPSYNRSSVYLFDPFAASFYLLSRYEEYLPFMKDKYGRFPAGESLAFAHGFLEKPLVDIWARDMGKKLMETFPDLLIQYTSYKFVPTIDVDAAFAYKHKGTLRTIGGYLKNLRDFDMADLKRRTRVLFGKEKDPFDTFDYIFDLHKRNNLKSIFFILFADYGTNDKNTPTYNRAFKELAAYISDNAEVGIHPSFTSNFIPSKLKKELRTLTNTVHQEIVKSRQHFLILHMPSTYRNLLNMGIIDDFSMGYAAEVGFRASTANSFLFYDLEMEYTTSLRIHPFAVMEGTLRDYKKLSIEDSLAKYQSIIDEVRMVGGTYISIWHNESLSNKNRWVGWNKLYEKMIEYARK